MTTSTTITPPRVQPAIKRMTFITAPGQATREADAVITASTSSVDREGDIVVPTGMRRDDLRNIPLLWGHDHSSLPIGAVTQLDVDERSIRAGWRWLTDDPFAQRVRNAFEQGIVRASSIGFLPHKAEPIKGGRGLRFTDWTLLELSLVPVGANADAVRQFKRLELDGPVSTDQASVLISELSTQLRNGKTLSAERELALHDTLVVIQALVKAESTSPPAPEMAVVGDDGVVIRIAPEVLSSAITTATKHEIATALGRIPDDEPIFVTRGSNEPVISLSNQELAELVREGLSASVRDALRDLTGRVD